MTSLPLLARLRVEYTGVNQCGEKHVEFEILQKDASIPRTCVQVPWKLLATPTVKWYNSYNETTRQTTREQKIDTSQSAPSIVYYIMDVLADIRLCTLAVNPDDNATAKPAVQEYANRMRNIADTTWVMEFVTNDCYARYCLVPIDSFSVLERIDTAISHLRTFMNDDTMIETTRAAARDEDDDALASAPRLKKSLVDYKNWNIKKLNEIRYKFNNR